MWAIVSPAGAVHADTDFRDENHAWQIVLGWPTEQEITDAKEDGYRAIEIPVHLPWIPEP